VAPYTRQSGRWKGKSMIAGGRAAARSAVFMAALTASQHNPLLKAFYRRLLAAGKPKMVALIAVARKLLVILNAMTRDKKPWQYARQTTQSLRRPRALARGRLEGWKHAPACCHPSRRSRDFVALAPQDDGEFVCSASRDLPMIVATLFFYLFACICVASGFMVIAARNPVHSVLFPIRPFFTPPPLFVLAFPAFLALIL